MRHIVLVLASAAALTTANSAMAQMYLPPSPGVTASQSYAPPTYTPAPPSYIPPGSTVPNYSWREQRSNDDWRNNTWREQRINEDWRNNNWRQERANEDWRQRESDIKTRTPNNAVDTGYISDPTNTAKNKAEKKDSETENECGVRSVGSPKPCLDYSEESAKIIVPPKDAKTIVPPRDPTKINPLSSKNPSSDKGYVGGR